MSELICKVELFLRKLDVQQEKIMEYGTLHVHAELFSGFSAGKNLPCTFTMRIIGASAG